MKKVFFSYAHSNDGFTLMELLVALGLTATVLGIMVAFFMNFSRASTIQNAAASAQHSVRAGLEYIMQDIRMAGLDHWRRPALESRKSLPVEKSCGSHRTAATCP